MFRYVFWYSISLFHSVKRMKQKNKQNKMNIGFHNYLISENCELAICNWNSVTSNLENLFQGRMHEMCIERGKGT